MSFVPGFAPDALSQWLALDFPSQEAVLDAIEEVVAAPPARAIYVADRVIDIGGVRRYLFISVTVDRHRERVTITGVVYHDQPPSNS